MPETVEAGLERRLKEKYDKSWTAATASYHQTVAELVRSLICGNHFFLSFLSCVHVEIVVAVVFAFLQQTERFQLAESNLEQVQTEHRLYKV